MPHTVRSFERHDRDQLIELVNLHIAAVIPGVAVSVNTVPSQLEREPLETIVDPWGVGATMPGRDRPPGQNSCRCSPSPIRHRARGVGRFRGRGRDPLAHVFSGPTRHRRSSDGRMLVGSR